MLRHNIRSSNQLRFLVHPIAFLAVALNGGESRAADDLAACCMPPGLSTCSGPKHEVCRSSADCPPGEECEDTACRDLDPWTCSSLTSPLSGPPCSVDVDCPPGAWCQGDGFCSGRVGLPVAELLCEDVGDVCKSEACLVGRGDCFSSGESAGCGESACCARVCATHPKCCESRWDEQCAAAAETLCEKSGCSVMLRSDPEPCSIDARRPFPINDPSKVEGWKQIDLTFEAGCLIERLNLLDLQVTTDPPTFSAPIIRAAQREENVVKLVFDRPIPLGAWTCVTYRPTQQTACIGALPADVDASRQSTVKDIAALVDSLNRVIPRPAHSTDIDRSGQTNVQDITVLIDLLNGAESYDPWNQQKLPLDCPSQ